MTGTSPGRYARARCVNSLFDSSVIPCLLFLNFGNLCETSSGELCCFGGYIPVTEP